MISRRTFVPSVCGACRVSISPRSYNRTFGLTFLNKEPAMPITKVPDRGGVTVTFQTVLGVGMSPISSDDVLPEVPKLKMREDDIIIAAWMRSGTHWMWEMVSMLVNNNTETIPKNKVLHMFEFQPISYYDDLSSPRVFNTHLKFRYLPEDLRTKRCRVIRLLRDPRDAMVSWYRTHLKHSPFDYKGEWYNWLPVELEGKFDWGNWYDHTRDWEKTLEDHPNLDVHYWFYEEMKKNPVEELRKVAQFFGTSTSESFLQAIVDKCELSKMREDKVKYERQEDGVIHYMKGQVGTWKELFTIQQYEMFEKMYREKMAGSKTEDRYKGKVEVL